MVAEVTAGDEAVVAGETAADSRATACVLLGPPGGGKGTLIARMLRELPCLHRVTCVTTRARRPAEPVGGQFRFVSPEAFADLVDAGELVAWNATNGDALYGLERAALDSRPGDRLGIFELDEVCLAQLQRHRLVRSILVAGPSMAEVRARLERRGGHAAAEIERRLATGRRIIAAPLGYDYVLINDELDRAAAELTTILVAEHARLTAPLRLAALRAGSRP